MRFLSEGGRGLALAALLVSCGLASCIMKVEKKIPAAADSQAGDQTGDYEIGEVGEAGELGEIGDALETDGEAAGEAVDAGGDGLPLDVGGLEVHLPSEDAQQVGPGGGVFLYQFSEGLVILVVEPDAVTGNGTVEVMKPNPRPEVTGIVPVTEVYQVLAEGVAVAAGAAVKLLLPLKPDLAVDPMDWPKLTGLTDDGTALTFKEKVPAGVDFAHGIVWLKPAHFSLFVAGIGEGATTSCLDFELCNGKDDDCDGQTDDELTDPAAAGCLTAGICNGKVTAECTGGEWLCHYPGEEEGFESGVETSCDNKDNDCDGATDEEIAGKVGAVVGTTCSAQGACEVANVYALCNKGKWYCDYSEVFGYEGNAELSCDGKDNDCDGKVDEGTCPAFSGCVPPAQPGDQTSCKSGSCVVPLGGEVAVCAEEAGTCVAAEEDATLKSVAAGGTWCAGVDKVAVCGEGGEWEEPVLCSTYEAGTSTCDATVHQCGGCKEDKECADDGDLCNGGMVCVGGSCQADPGTAVACPPDTACQKQVCVPATGECQGTPANEGEPCEGGDPCKEQGQCTGGLCVQSQPKVCDDSNVCTADTCDQAGGGCKFDPAPLAGGGCNDKSACTDNDLCQADGSCKGTAKSCDDGSACTQDTCNPGTGACGHQLQAGLECDDFDPCTENDACDAQGFCAGSPLTCNDDNDCTDDACDPALNGCDYKPKTGQDLNCLYPNSKPGQQDPCIQLGKCSEGECLPGPSSCECQSDKDCVVKDDGDLCNGLMMCDLSVVPYTCKPKPDSAVACDPSGDKACAKAKCVPASGLCQLSEVADGMPCSDGDACTTDDKCAGGECVDLTPVDCDDDNACTNDQCVPASGCVHPKLPAGAGCEDGDPCTVGDKCSATATCTPGTPKKCDDSNPCTTNTCSENGTDCLFVPIPGCCQSDGECLFPQVCFNTKCCLPTCSDELGPFACGDNACGGSCGTCPQGQECFNHACCTPNCTSPPKTCGDDGCGKTCGTCTPPQVCSAMFACCTPECAGKECGDNKCGGQCGPCPAGKKCNLNTSLCEQCTAVCTGKQCGDDGCGGSCGTCQAGEVCLAAGTCCKPSCAGKTCGSDGCGGSCGTCGAGFECVSGACSCAVCCTNDLKCAYDETCTGTTELEGQPATVCKKDVMPYFVGFENAPQGKAYSGFTYSWVTTIPWLVTSVDAGGFAHTGQSSFKYNKTGNGSGIFWFYAWLPAQNPPQTARLSFFLRCDNSTAWTLDVLVNDAKVATATQAICIKDFQRMTADLAAFPPGKVKIEFKMTKTVPQAVTLYLDDLAILSDNCNAAAACVSYTPQAGVCTQSAITGGTCYIDYTCYAQDGANPANKCAVCKPSTSQTAWSPDDAKCDDGNPATTDKCSVTDGCANF